MSLMQKPAIPNVIPSLSTAEMMEMFNLKFILPNLKLDTSEEYEKYVDSIIRAQLVCFSLETIRTLCRIAGLEKIMSYDTRVGYAMRIGRFTVFYSSLFSEYFPDIFISHIDGQLGKDSQCSDLDWYKTQSDSFDEDKNFQKFKVWRKFLERQALTLDKLVHISMPLYHTGYETNSTKFYFDRKEDLVINNVIHGWKPINDISTLKIFHDPNFLEEFQVVDREQIENIEFFQVMFDSGNRYVFEKRFNDLWITLLIRPESSKGTKFVKKYGSFKVLKVVAIYNNTKTTTKNILITKL